MWERSISASAVCSSADTSHVSFFAYQAMSAVVQNGIAPSRQPVGRQCSCCCLSHQSHLLLEVLLSSHCQIQA